MSQQRASVRQPTRFHSIQPVTAGKPQTLPGAWFAADIALRLTKFDLGVQSQAFEALWVICKPTPVASARFSIVVFFCTQAPG
jgi:hypothetical protein